MMVSRMYVTPRNNQLFILSCSNITPCTCRALNQPCLSVGCSRTIPNPRVPTHSRAEAVRGAHVTVGFVVLRAGPQPPPRTLSCETPRVGESAGATPQRLIEGREGSYGRYTAAQNRRLQRHQPQPHYERVDAHAQRVTEEPDDAHECGEYRCGEAHLRGQVGEVRHASRFLVDTLS